MPGKIIERKKMKIAGMDVELITREVPNFRRRKKVIFRLGGDEPIQLGHLITVYMVAPRKDNFAPVKYVPFFYEVKLNDEADLSEVEDYYAEPEVKGEYEFDDKDEALAFIDGLMYEGSKHGICVDTNAEFKRWVEVMKRVKNQPSTAASGS